MKEEQSTRESSNSSPIHTLLSMVGHVATFKASPPAPLFELSSESMNAPNARSEIEFQILRLEVGGVER